MRLTVADALVIASFIVGLGTVSSVERAPLDAPAASPRIAEADGAVFPEPVVAGPVEAEIQTSSASVGDADASPRAIPVVEEIHDHQKPADGIVADAADAADAGGTTAVALTTTEPAGVAVRDEDVVAAILAAVAPAPEANAEALAEAIAAPIESGATIAAESKTTPCPKCRLWAHYPRHKPEPPALFGTATPAAPENALIEMVVVDGAAHPTMATYSPFDARMSSGPDESGRKSLIAAAFKAHRPDNRWKERVEQVKTSGDAVAMLKKADSLIDGHMAYVDYPGYDWRNPGFALSAGGVCREFALAKIKLLADAGFPLENLRVATVTPKAPSRLVWHVVAVARTPDGKDFVLDMYDKQASAKEGIAIPRSSYDASRGIVWAGHPFGHAYLQHVPTYDRRPHRNAKAADVSEASDHVTETPTEADPTDDWRKTAPSGRVIQVKRAPGDFLRYQVERSPKP